MSKAGRSIGKPKTSTPDSASGVWTMGEAYEAMLDNIWPAGITDSLVVYLDAGNAESYPGYGGYWYDLSGNNNHFRVVPSAWNTAANGAAYMDFNGSHGIAKNTADISLSDSTGVTYCVLTRVKNSTAQWRTLTRSYSADHHVIIQSGAWNIGMYDNNASGFLDSGYDQTSLPNHGTTDWAFLYWRWSSSSPYYVFSYNDTPGTTRGSITNSNARYNRGFGSLGGYHDGNNNPYGNSQQWGDIAVFMAYSRILSNDELLQIYSLYKNRYSL